MASSKKVDFRYITGNDGFTAIMPETVEGEREYNRIFADGVIRFTPQEFKAFKSQANRAGYRVCKAYPVSLDDIMGMDVLELLEGLSA